MFSTTLNIEKLLPEVDLVVGAVLVHGAKAPHVITRDQLRLMKKNAVLVDVSIDQGGCFETSHPTTHTNPTYEVDGVTHYCVANMPGAVPITSTFALTNATMPYVIKLAEQGARAALESDPGFLAGLNVAAGEVTYAPVAADQGLTAVDPRRGAGEGPGRGLARSGFDARAPHRRHVRAGRGTTDDRRARGDRDPRRFPVDCARGAVGDCARWRSRAQDASVAGRRGEHRDDEASSLASTRSATTRGLADPGRSERVVGARDIDHAAALARRARLDDRRPVEACRSVYRGPRWRRGRRRSRLCAIGIGGRALDR